VCSSGHRLRNHLKMCNPGLHLLSSTLRQYESNNSIPLWHTCFAHQCRHPEDLTQDKSKGDVRVADQTDPGAMNGNVTFVLRLYHTVRADNTNASLNGIGLKLT